jgi:hypothetical protein
MKVTVWGLNNKELHSLRNSLHSDRKYEVEYKFYFSFYSLLPLRRLCELLSYQVLPVF